MFVSIIVPTRKINDYIRKEIIPALEKQTYQNFELIIVPNKYRDKENFPAFVRIISSWPKTGPADKRDLAVSQAKGETVAFTDDDAYPAPDWLENIVKILGYQPPTANHQPQTTNHQPGIAAVCGPGITPPTDTLSEKVSGWVWGSTMGAGGVGRYRCTPRAKREVDDFPSFNLIVRKSDFEKVGGFNTHLWSGEDTKLCHKLVYELGKKIIYDPNILVYHHRRPIFGPHLVQIARYGVHRGFFARTLPTTSRRLGYFAPTVFTVYLLVLPFLLWGFREFGGIGGIRGIWGIVLAPIALYFSLLLATAGKVFYHERNLKGVLFLVPAIFTTHIVYGLAFIKGFLSRKLKE